MSELLESIVSKRVNFVNDNLLGGCDANAAHALFLGVALNRGAKEHTAHAVLDAIVGGRNNSTDDELTYTDILLSEFDQQCGGDCELSPRLNKCRTIEAALKVLMALRRNERLVYNSDRTLFLGYIAGRAAAAPPVPAD
jgi:hypothetical protein